MKDYYRILGLTQKATDEDIKRAFRKLAREFHPDTNPHKATAEARFKEISEAYDVLGDPPKRREYDELQRPRSGGPAGGFRTQQAGHAGFGGFDDLLGSFFRNASARGAKPGERPGGSKGEDVEAEAEVTLEEAIAGTSLVLNVTTATGETRRLRVPVPPGVTNGTRVRVAGEGEPGLAGGAPGDLFVKIGVKPHERFEREGDNLLLELPVSVFEAVLGGELTVPTIDGEVKLKLPPGTQGGQVFRLKNKGVPVLKGSGRGALMVKVQLQIPKAIGAADRALWQQLADRERATGKP